MDLEIWLDWRFNWVGHLVGLEICLGRRYGWVRDGVGLDVSLHFTLCFVGDLLRLGGDGDFVEMGWAGELVGFEIWLGWRFGLIWLGWTDDWVGLGWFGDSV